jgi:hypothetical protein
MFNGGRVDARELVVGGPLGGVLWFQACSRVYFNYLLFAAIDML